MRQSAATPTTVNGTLAMRTLWPIGSELAPNRLAATVWPSTTVLAPASTSSGDSTAPRRAGQLRMSKNSGVVPVTTVDQFLSSATTWALV